MSAPTTALALRPCMALVRVEPPPASPWPRGRLRELLLAHLKYQLHREQLQRALAPYYPEWFLRKASRLLLALVLGVFVSACGAEPAPPGPRPITQAPLQDMAQPSTGDGGACLPCKPDQPDTCLGAIGRCELAQGRYCCSLPWPYSCRWHTCSPTDPGSCQGGTCQPVSGGSCCVYGAPIAAKGQQHPVGTTDEMSGGPGDAR